MRFVALVSGGKDSIYSIVEARRQGHTLICAAHLSPGIDRRRGRGPGPGSDSDERADDAEVEDGDADADAEAESEPVLEMDSYMYQSAASNVVRTQVEECMDVPFVTRRVTGSSVNTSLVYDHVGIGTSEGDEGADNEEADEVEDLYRLLSDVVRIHPTVEAVSCGAILSTYQRVRLESVCSRLGLTPLCYLWRVMPQSTLLDRMIDDDGIEAVMVKTTSGGIGLTATRHLNRSLSVLRDKFHNLERKFGFHVCGEGGEYETLVLDCPWFVKRLVLDEVEIVHDGEEGGMLRIVKFHAEDKEDGGDVIRGCSTLFSHDVVGGDVATHARKESSNLRSSNNGGLPPQHVSNDDDGKGRDVTSRPDGEQADTRRKGDFLGRCRRQYAFPPHARMLPGGLLQVSEILSPHPAPATTATTAATIDDPIIIPTTTTTDRTTAASADADADADSEAEASAAVREALDIFNLTRLVLRHHDMTTCDVVYCHLYLSQMSHFARINEHYRECFGIVLPPSRSCVSLGRNALPGGRRVSMDVLAQRGSGGWMRRQQQRQRPESTMMCCSSSSGNKPREVLHVQSRSHWAPTCVGPYSQANTLRGGVIWMAGQIGLRPSTMTLVCGDGDADGHHDEGDDGNCEDEHGGKKRMDDDMKEDWQMQLYQSWTNAASILDALDGGRLTDCLGALVYIKSDIVLNGGCGDGDVVADADQLWRKARSVCVRALGTNGDVVPGAVDGHVIDPSEDEFGGYEDEETRMAMEGPKTNDGPSSVDEDEETVARMIPLSFVAIPEMPVGALCEVELVCSTSRARECLGVTTEALPKVLVRGNGGDENGIFTYYQDESSSSSSIVWDCGYDPPPQGEEGRCRHHKKLDAGGGGDDGAASSRTQQQESKIALETKVRFVRGCCAIAWITVGPENDATTTPAPPSCDDDAIGDMVNASGANSSAPLSRSLHTTTTDESSSAPAITEGKRSAAEAATAAPVFECIDLDVLLRSIVDQVGEAANASGMDESHVLHVRLFHPSWMGDGIGIRTALVAELGRMAGHSNNASSSCTVVSVSTLEGGALFLAQVTIANLVHMETEIWIHHGREYHDG